MQKPNLLDRKLLEVTIQQVHSDQKQVKNKTHNQIELKLVVACLISKKSNQYLKKKYALKSPIPLIVTSLQL